MVYDEDGGYECSKYKIAKLSFRQSSASKSIMIPMLIFIIMMANVSVLSKLGKFFHPINPTRQYQACVLSTHRSKMLLSSATPHNHINIKLLAY